MSAVERPIVDFDHHSQEFHQNRHGEWAELRRCPVAFNPNFGGFWVVSGYDEVAAVSRLRSTASVPSRSLHPSISSTSPLVICCCSSVIWGM